MGARMSAPGPDLTGLLRDWQSGDEAALAALVPMISETLSRLAHRYISRERAGHTLQTTALVNEAYARLIEDSPAEWRDRTHFFAASARIMRNILVDHARQNASAKRGGGREKLSLDAVADLAPERAAELVALDDALSALGKSHPRAARVVELRHFGGLNNDEAAMILDVSATTVERDWRFARAWLYRELDEA